MQSSMPIPSIHPSIHPSIDSFIHSFIHSVIPSFFFAHSDTPMSFYQIHIYSHCLYFILTRLIVVHTSYIFFRSNSHLFTLFVCSCYQKSPLFTLFILHRLLTQLYSHCSYYIVYQTRLYNTVYTALFIELFVHTIYIALFAKLTFIHTVYISLFVKPTFIHTVHITLFIKLTFIHTVYTALFIKLILIHTIYIALFIKPTFIHTVYTELFIKPTFIHTVNFVLCIKPTFIHPASCGFQFALYLNDWRHVSHDNYIDIQNDANASRSGEFYYIISNRITINPGVMWLITRWFTVFYRWVNSRDML